MELTRRVVFRTVQFPRISWTWIPLALLVGLLILILAYPLALLFVKSFVISRPGQPTVWAVNGWVEAFTDVNLAIAIGNTFYLAFVRVIITSVLAIFFAWVVTRTDTPLKGFIEVALWLGFFLPLLPMTMGWILLLDPYYGLINKCLDESFRALTASLRYLFLLGDHLVPFSFQYLRQIPFDDSGIHGYGRSTGGCRAYVRQQQHGSLNTHHRTDFSTRHSCLHGLGFHQEP